MTGFLSDEELRAVAAIAELLGPDAHEDARTVEAVNAGAGAARVAVLGEYAPKWRALRAVVGDASPLERHDIDRPELFRLRTAGRPIAEHAGPAGVAYAGRFPWDADLDLVDVPPSEMRRLLQAGRVADLGYVDALMLLVFADSQVTKHERDFLLEFCARFPETPLAILVADLDRVPEPERRVVHARLVRQAAGLGPQAEVFVERDTESAAARAAHHLREVAGGFDPRDDRALRALWLGDALRRLAVQVEGRMHDVRTDRPDDLEPCLDRLAARGRRCVAEVGEYLSRERELLVCDLVGELETAQDPDRFWFDELPLRLRRELVSRALRVQDDIRDEICRDVSWLQQELRSVYGLPVELERPAVLLPDCRVPDVGRLGLDQNERVVWLASLGSASLSAASPLVESVWHVDIGPVEAIGEMVARRVRTLRHRHSRGASVPTLEGLLRDTVDEMIRAESGRIAGLYTQIAEQLRAASTPPNRRESEDVWEVQAARTLVELSVEVGRRHAPMKGEPR